MKMIIRMISVIFLSFLVFRIEAVNHCTYMGDVQPMDACSTGPRSGQNVLIDFQRAAKHRGHSCKCDIYVNEDGFLAIQALRVPDSGDCGSEAVLTSSARKSSTKFKCGVKHATRLVPLSNSITLTLDLNKTNNQDQDVETNFCFVFSGRMTMSVRCYSYNLQPPFTLMTRPAPWTKQTTTSSTEASPPNDESQSSSTTATEAIPAAVGGVAFVIIVIVTVTCFIRRNRKKNSKGFVSSSNDTSESKYEKERPNTTYPNGHRSLEAYLSMYHPHGNPPSTPPVDTAPPTVSKMTQNNYANAPSHHISNGGQQQPISTESSIDVNSGYETTGYETSLRYEDDEHPYADIADVNYENEDGVGMDNPDYCYIQEH